MGRIKLYLVFLFLACFQHFSFAQNVIDFKGNFGEIGDRIEILVDSNSNISLATALNLHIIKNPKVNSRTF